MKVEIGSDFKVLGTVEMTPTGLSIQGDKEKLNRLLDSMRQDMSDEELINSLTRRLNGRTWARRINDIKKKALVDPDVINHINSQNNDLFFMLKLGDIPTIKRWQDHAREALQGSNIKWDDPDNFHVTLVFVPDIPASETLQLTMGVDVAEATPLTIEGFGTFSIERGDKTNVLYLSVKKTPELAAIQARLYNFVISEGMTTSPFSIPEDWIPHITLASSEKPFDEAAFPSVGGMAVEAEAIEASVDFEAIAISEKFNPYHVPAGSPEGGQFTTGEGAGGGLFNQKVHDALTSGEAELEFVGGGINATSKLITDDGEEFFIKHLGFDESFMIDRNLAAKQVADVVGLEDNVPNTWDASAEETNYLATEWIDGKSWASLTDKERRAVLSSIPEDQLTKVILYDYVVGNVDRHVGNVMLDSSGNILLIDNDLILMGGNSIHAPTSIGLTRNTLLTNEVQNRSMSVSAVQDIISSKENIVSIVASYETKLSEDEILSFGSTSSVNSSLVSGRIDALDTLLQSRESLTFGEFRYTIGTLE